MISYINKAVGAKSLSIILLLLLMLSACKDAWKSEELATETALDRNLMQQIAQNPDLSRFTALLRQVHYDALLEASKTYTVWAPTNDALAHVSQELLADTAWLKVFLGFHIAGQRHMAQQQEQIVRVQTISGKMVHFDQQYVEQVAMTEKDQLVANGVLHIISEVLLPKENIWQWITHFQEKGQQQQYIESLWGPQFDRNASTQIGVNEEGLPIYDSVFTLQNSYLNQVADLSDEKKEFTYLILDDAAFEQETSQLAKFFVDTTAELSAYRTHWNVVKDLVIAGKVTPDMFDQTLYSIKDSMTLRLHQADMVQQFEASNGMVYVVSKLDDDIHTKIKPIIVEGESPVEVRDGKSITRRTRVDPNGVVFRDLLLQNHGVNGMWVRYFPQVYSGTYNVYWRVIRDADLILTPAAGAADLVHFPMKVTWGDDPLTSPSTPGLGYIQEPVINQGDGTFSPNYEEQLIGQLTVDLYGRISIYLVGNTSTTNGQNTLLLDYLKLEPVY